MSHYCKNLQNIGKQFGKNIHEKLSFNLLSEHIRLPGPGTQDPGPITRYSGPGSGEMGPVTRDLGPMKQGT